MPSPSATNRVWTVPNLLSTARLGLAIVVFVLIEWQRFGAAAAVFLVAASTDWIDGWWARRFGQVSRLGRIFDPLVDKVIVCGGFIQLADRSGSAILPWMAVIVVVRELVVTAVRAEMERAGYDFSAVFSGKLKMVLQCMAIAGELVARTLPDGAVGPASPRSIAAASAWAAVVVTVWSGLVYIVAARSLLVEADRHDEREGRQR